MNKLCMWQLFFIRLYIGFNFLPYAIQQLFSGSAVRTEVANIYAELGISHPGFMVWFVGTCMLFAAIGLIFGIFTRIVALLSSVFLVFSLFMGHHNQHGFFWFLPGGGWEFLSFWSFLCLTFVITGGGRFSIDAKLLSVVHPECIFRFNRTLIPA